MGREKIEKSLSGLEREYGIPRRTIQGVFEHFTGRTVIQSEQDFDIADKCAKALVRHEKKKKAIAYIEADTDIMASIADLVSQQQSPVIQSKEDSHIEEDPEAEAESSVSDIQFISRQLKNLTLELREQKEELARARKAPLWEALRPKTKQEIAAKLQATAFELHNDFNFQIKGPVAFYWIGSIIKQFGPGPFYSAIGSIYKQDAISRLKGQGGITPNSDLDGFFPLIQSTAEKLWKTGAYASAEELVVFLHIDPSKATEIVQPLHEKPEEVRDPAQVFAEGLFSKYYSRVVARYTVAAFCGAVSSNDKGQLDIDGLDHEGLNAKILEIMSNKELRDKLITCEGDIPFSIHDFIKESY